MTDHRLTDSSETLPDMKLKLREADFLLSVTDISDRNGLDFNATFKDITQFTADFIEGPACCETRIGKHEYRSRNFARLSTESTETISANGHSIGYIRLYSPNSAQSSVSAELLRVLAERLGSIARCSQVLESLKTQTSIVDSLHESVIYRDMNGYIRSWNKGAERLFGFTEDEAIGKHISIVYPKGEYEILENRGFEKLFSKGYFGTDVLLMRKDNSTFHAHLSMTLVEDADGNFKGMIGLGMDIDKRKKAEIALIKERDTLLSERDRLIQRVDELQQDRNALQEMLTISDQKSPRKAEISQETTDKLLALINSLRIDSTKETADRLTEIQDEIIAITESDSEHQSLFTGLTSREIEISSLIREDRTTREIADTLFISPETVQKHRRNIRKKLGITGKPVNLPVFLKTYQD